MAITDRGNFISCKQILDEEKISFGQQYVDYQASIDIGQTVIPMFVKFIAHGVFTKGLKIELAMANKPDFTDAVAVNGVDVAQTDLKAGWSTFLKIPATGKKYRYLCAKYTPTGASAENTGKVEPICPSSPTLNKTGEIQKAISAFVCTVDDFDTIYPINI